MHKYLGGSTLIAGAGLAAGSSFPFNTSQTSAQAKHSTAAFDSDGKLKLPTGYPNGLNNGKANFPEYHHIYIEKQNVDAYLKTGSFPEGTVIVKELTRVLDPTFPDGSRAEPSGRGYFNGEYNAISPMSPKPT
ncbi:MAG TPA: cytochrome P460 family protein [Terriglobales bacterium]|nr:cytochrome P460 family protein [Terriglobales bacterium]